MTHPSPHSPAPEVELDPAAEHVTRHVASATSTALAATQHAMQSATLRAYLARDTASAEARASQRALHAQQQVAHTGEVTDRAADRPGIAASPAAPSAPSSPSSSQEAAATPTEQWTAYADGAEAAALGGRGVCTPPEQVLAHVDARPGATRPDATPAVDDAELGVGLAAPDPVLGHGIDPGMDRGITSGTSVPGPTPGIEP